jgi:predicted dehydrogenase
VQAVERNGRKLAMAEQLSFAPFTLAWSELLAAGELGKVTYAEAQYIHGMHLDWYWIDSVTGQYLTFEEARQNPNAQKTRFWNIVHPIWYNPHSLGPLLRILDERIVRVTCMSAPRPSAFLPEVPLPDVEVALLQTDGDTILRVTTGFVAPTPRPWLWYHLLGTRGEVETSRQTDIDGAVGDDGLVWLADRFMPTRTPIRWGYTDAQRGVAQAAASSHGGLDYYPIADFVESILDDRSPVVDVYRAAEIAAAGVVAGMSAEQGSVPLAVPNFRPGADRAEVPQPVEVTE